MATKKSPPPPKPSISSLARKHQVCRETIRKIRDSGIALDDEGAVARALAVSRAKLESSSPAAPAADGGESFSEAKRRRAVADANRAEIIAAKESGSVIEVAEVEDLMTRLASEMRSRLLSWVGSLPPMVEGLTAARIQPILLQKVSDLLASIHENRPIKNKP